MNKTRRLLLITGAALICVAVVVLLVFNASANSENEIPAYTGRGDYQRYEAQFFHTDTETQQSRPPVGMGDLRRFEAQDIQNSGVLNDNHTYVGMGDLRRFEALQMEMTK